MEANLRTVLVDTSGSDLYTDAGAAHLAAFFKGSPLGKTLFSQIAENMGYHTKTEKEVAKKFQLFSATLVETIGFLKDLGLSRRR